MAPEIDRSAPDKLQAKASAASDDVIRIGSGEKRALRFDDVLGMGGDLRRKLLAELTPKLQFDDPINIQFTEWYGTCG